jgi:hypothetical protein
MGTSLTVYFSSVVTFCPDTELAEFPEFEEEAGAGVVVESVGGGVED